MRHHTLVVLLALVTLVWLAAPAMASVPHTLAWQGVALNSSGFPVPDSSYSVTFSIWTAAGGGTSLWSESQVVSTENGVMNVLLGLSTPVPDDVFADTLCYLQIQIGADPPYVPRTRIVSVGFAFRAGTVDGASGGTITSKLSIGPGHTNTGQNAFVAGADNTVSDNGATVGGGGFNRATGFYSVIAGGGGQFATDSNLASGNRSTIGGGYGNMASAFLATVSGGSYNSATSRDATVAGGNANGASDTGATVSGGELNFATADYATIPGGYSNQAGGRFSLAAGRRAKANHAGCLVWADSTDTDFSSSADNQFLVRASGGATIYSNASASAGVTLAAGSGTWASASDVRLKDNFRPVDGAEILAKLAQLPISTWNYKSQEAGIRHMGPTAQDFARLFELGDDNVHIATIDPDGVALAAIQELHRRTEEIQALRARIEQMEQEQLVSRSAFAERLAALEAFLKAGGPESLVPPARPLSDTPVGVSSLPEGGR